jgi:UDPglucose 6-dehydrogenase
MIKYASNAFLATKISFVNAIANVCEAVNADVREVVLGMGYDPRIGFEFLHPGPGWGGSCFPKDTAALLRTADEAGYDFALLRGAVTANDEQRDRMVTKVRDACGGTLAGARVAIWGLTFKANTDDLRDSPAVAIAAILAEEGAVLRAYDPSAGDAAAGLPGLEVVADAYEACTDAQVLVVLTEWDEFRWLDFERVAASMSRAEVVDARNLLDPAAMRHIGFTYRGVGR